jgi:hypothetical protein
MPSCRPGLLCLCVGVSVSVLHAGSTLPYPLLGPLTSCRRPCVGTAPCRRPPAAVGQVQDVGLIFLSAMATSIASLCLEAGRDAATALGTSMLTMSLATFFTGAMTLLVGERGAGVGAGAHNG